MTEELPPGAINPWRRWHGALVPNWLLKQPGVPAAAKLLYARLAQFAGQKGQCWPAQEELAHELGVSSRTVRQHLRKLVHLGLIRKWQRGLGWPNTYYFLSHSWIPTDRNDPSGLEGMETAAPVRNSAADPVRADSGLQNQDTHYTPRPPSLEEVLQYAASRGIAQPAALKFFSTNEANNWIYLGKPTTNWRASLDRYWIAWQRNDRAGRPSPDRAAAPRHRRVAPPEAFHQTRL